MSDLNDGMSGLSEEAASAVRQLTLAECFKDWKDWFRDRPAIQARWDARRERLRLERGTAQAAGPSRRQGRL